MDWNLWEDYIALNSDRFVSINAKRGCADEDVFV